VTDTAHAIGTVGRPIPLAERIVARMRFALGLGGVFVVSVTAVLVLWIVFPVVFLGWHAYSLRSDSMSPAVDRGDVVLVAPSDDRPGRGMIVVFDDDAGHTTAHRVVEVLGDGTYVTKGDANDEADTAPVRTSQVQGTARMIVPYAGLPRAWLSAGQDARLATLGAGLLLSAYVSRFAKGRTRWRTT
jgi:signal peptidase I